MLKKIVMKLHCFKGQIAKWKKYFANYVAKGCWKTMFLNVKLFLICPPSNCRKFTAETRCTRGLVWISANGWVSQTIVRMWQLFFFCKFTYAATILSEITFCWHPCSNGFYKLFQIGGMLNQIELIGQSRWVRLAYWADVPCRFFLMRMTTYITTL